VWGRDEFGEAGFTNWGVFGPSPPVSGEGDCDDDSVESEKVRQEFAKLGKILSLGECSAGFDTMRIE